MSLVDTVGQFGIESHPDLVARRRPEGGAAHHVLGRVKKAHHCGYVVAQNIPFGEAEPEGRPSVGVRHVVGRGAREGGLRQGGRLTKARGRSPRRGKNRARIVEKSPEGQNSCRLASHGHSEVVAMVKNGGTGEHC